MRTLKNSFCILSANLLGYAFLYSYYMHAWLIVAPKSGLQTTILFFTSLQPFFLEAICMTSLHQLFQFIVISRFILQFVWLTLIVLSLRICKKNNLTRIRCHPFKVYAFQQLQISSFFSKRVIWCPGCYVAYWMQIKSDYSTFIVLYVCFNMPILAYIFGLFIITFVSCQRSRLCFTAGLMLHLNYLQRMTMMILQSVTVHFW